MRNNAHLRQLLDEIKSLRCKDNAAELARTIGKDASYVNRLLWDEEKKGAKGIGPEIMAACQKAFNLPRGFWEMDMEEATHVLEKDAQQKGETRVVANPFSRSAWPFSDELLRFLAKMPGDDLRKIENGLRGQLDMPLLAPKQSLANGE